MLGLLLDSRYRLVQSLGAGGFSQTYIAEDTRRPGSPVCVVKHLKSTASSPQFLDMSRRLFLKEAEALEKLGNFDRIPRLLAYFEEGGEFYLVQELIEGSTLSSEMPPGCHWLESAVIELLQDCLTTLEFVHSYNVIHRDVKPDNIIRRQSDRKLVLVDFGTVKETNTQVNESIGEAPNTIGIGTYGYMPVEQIRGKPRKSSDIYALGIICIQALTGIMPMELEEDVNTEELIWQNHAEQASNELKSILAKMVCYQSKNRYQSASEALEAIQPLLLAYPSIQMNTSLGYALTQPASPPGYLPTQVNHLPISKQKSIPKTQPISTQPINYANGTKPDDSGKEGSIPSSNSIPISNSSTASSNTSLLNDTTETTRQDTNNILNQLITLLKSSLGLTIGVAAIVALLATVALDWSSTGTKEKLVQDLKQLLKESRYEECIKQVKNPKTVKLFTGSSPSAKKTENEIYSILGECQLAQAKDLAGNIKFAEAVELADQVPNVIKASAEAQKLIAQWSISILENATEIYEERGSLDEAVTLARRIPSKSPNFDEAREKSLQWQQETKFNKKLLKSAQEALDQGQWQKALFEARLIISTPYWRNQSDRIIREAEKYTKSPSPSPLSPPTSTPSPNPKSSTTPSPTPTPVDTPTLSPAPTPTNGLDICPGPLCLDNSNSRQKK
ncbi:MAG: serine/threonine-protein kinase [bacterium]|nr:serine/threonine-protein kinase [bacterium]